MNILNEIWKAANRIAGYDFIYLDSAIEIKLTPHRHPVRIWGVTANKDGSVMLLTNDEKWYELGESDLNYEIVGGSVYQRLKVYKQKTA